MGPLVALLALTGSQRIDDNQEHFASSSILSKFCIMVGSNLVEGALSFFAYRTRSADEMTTIRGSCMAIEFIPQLWVIGEVLLAMALGGVIGIERELADRPAGFRTHMLVSASAALIVGLGGALLAHFEGRSELLNSDPLRIVEAVITGVSFLGAGTIFRRSNGDQIEGLTTAASLLFVAVVGVVVAVGQAATAIVLTALVLLILRSGHRLERWLKERRDQS
jgi:putative Mg2+ transporter-C (MgtC) family protein